MERLLILRRLLREVLSDDPFLCQENYRWENEFGRCACKMESNGVQGATSGIKKQVV